MSYVATSSNRWPASSQTSSRLKAYSQIIYALIMHDIKNRFFGSGIGQIVMVIWPFAHIGILITVYVVTNRPHPYGDSLLQYSAVSIYPFICLNYVSRWISYSAQTNRSFLNYPIIKPLDILVARTLLEIVSITIVGILLVIVLIAAGENPVPQDPLQAASAVLATILLSIGFGFLNAPFAFLFQFQLLLMSVFVLIFYASSGIVFVPSSLPDPIRTYLSYNPLLQCTEWIRSAYFVDYPNYVLDKSYVLECGISFMAIGIVLMKLLRRYF